VANSDNIAIKVSNVSKTFKLPHEKHSSIKGALVGVFNSNKSYEKQRVLKDISFEINKGEFFGIVGRNGSGKSTLLKLLAGIYSPDKGNIQINGKLTPFIELGVGFNPELTGRENVFLNGALLGFSRKEMAEMYDEIVEFAELEKFMDQKLKNYSSGMQVRLAFSIAIRAETEILVLDEVLAVGDEAFQKKCANYFKELKKKKKTVVLVTHSMDAVRQFCDKAFMLSEGEILVYGSPAKVASQYSLQNMEKENNSDKTRSNLGKEVKSLKVRPLSKLSLSSGDDFIFEVSYELNQDIKVDLGITIAYQGQSIIEHNTRDIEIGSKKGIEYKIGYRLPLSEFNPKKLSLDVAIFEKREFRLIGFNTDACSFIISSDDGPKGGLLQKKGEWIVEQDTK